MQDHKRADQERPDPNEKLVKVFDAGQESEALVVKGLLESAGMTLAQTNAEKLAQVQARIAAEPPAPRVPRERPELPPLPSSRGCDEASANDFVDGGAGIVQVFAFELSVLSRKLGPWPYFRLPPAP